MATTQIGLQQMVKMELDRK